MPLDELRSTVSDGCLALPLVRDSEDLGDRMVALMATVAVSVLVERLESDDRHDEALTVLADFTGSPELLSSLSR